MMTEDTVLLNGSDRGDALNAEGADGSNTGDGRENDSPVDMEFRFKQGFHLCLIFFI